MAILTMAIADAIAIAALCTSTWRGTATAN